MPPGMHVLAARVDGALGLVAMRRQVAADRGDGAVLAIDVGHVVVRRRDHASVGDEQRHGAHRLTKMTLGPRGETDWRPASDESVNPERRTPARHHPTVPPPPAVPAANQHKCI